MSLRILSSAISFWLIASSILHSDEIPNSSFSSGNWNGAAYSDSTDGRFSHCVIAAEYLSGDTLLFSVNRDATISVGVANPDFNLTPGINIPVTLYVDRRRPFYGVARAIDEKFARLVLDDFERAMTALRRGYVLKIVSDSWTGEYNLSGTNRALEVATNCAIQHYEHTYIAPAEETPDSSSIMSRDDTAMLFQLASQMIAEAGVRDFRFLNEEETKLVSSHPSVFWSNDTGSLIAGVLFLDQPGIDSLRDSDAGDIAYLASLCDGDYANSAREIRQDNYVAREIRMICQSDLSSEMFLTKTRARDRVLYTVMIFTEDFAPEPGKSVGEISKDVGIRNANFALNSE